MGVVRVQLFDGYDFGLEGLHQRLDILGDLTELPLEGLAALRANDAGLYQILQAGLGLQTGIPTNLQTRIDPEDSHFKA
jgi:hypothetical protein